MKTYKSCPKCGCIELFSNGRKKRVEYENMQAGHRMIRICLFYETLKIWKCGNKKCNYSWEQLLNRHEFSGRDECDSNTEFVLLS